MRTPRRLPVAVRELRRAARRFGAPLLFTARRALRLRCVSLFALKESLDCDSDPGGTRGGTR